MPESAPPTLYTTGRLLSWLVVALMAGAILYSFWIGITNWSEIMV